MASRVLNIHVLHLYAARLTHHVVVQLAQLFSRNLRKLLFDLLQTGLLVLYHLLYGHLLFGGYLDGSVFELLLLHFLHEEGEVSIFFEVPGEDLLIFG